MLPSGAAGLFHRHGWLWLRRGAGGRVARRWLVAVGVGGSGRHGGGDLGCLELAGRAGVGGWLAGWCPDDLLGLGADPVQEPLRQTQQDRDPQQLGGWQPGKTGAHVQGW
jgi:hypothetical protein